MLLRGFMLHPSSPSQILRSEHFQLSSVTKILLGPTLLLIKWLIAFIFAVNKFIIFDRRIREEMPPVSTRLPKLLDLIPRSALALSHKCYPPPSHSLEKNRAAARLNLHHERFCTSLEGPFPKFCIYIITISLRYHKRSWTQCSKYDTIYWIGSYRP